MCAEVSLSFNDEDEFKKKKLNNWKSNCGHLLAIVKNMKLHK